MVAMCVAAVETYRLSTIVHLQGTFTEFDRCCLARPIQNLPHCLEEEVARLHELVGRRRHADA